MVISERKFKTMGLLHGGHALVSHLITKQKLSKGTVVTRRSRIRIFINWLPDFIDYITPAIIEEFFYYLQTEKDLLNTSLNTYFHALASYERFLIDQGHPPFMKEMTRYKENDANIIPLTVNEVKVLKEACMTATKPLEQTQKDMVIFFIDTGCRWEDAQNMLCENIDLIAKEIRYIQLKTGSLRVITIDEPLQSILARRIKNKQRKCHVFQNNAGGFMHYPDFYQFLKKLSASVDISKRVSPHVLRHSYAQNFYDQTRDILLTKDLIGHKNIESTMRYARNSRETVRNAQQSHPHLDIHPHMLLEKIEEQLKSHIDNQFNRIKAKRAINSFMEELHQASLYPECKKICLHQLFK